MTRIFVVLIALLAFANTAQAQSTPTPPKQCRAGYSTTDRVDQRTDMNTGAVIVDLENGTIRARRDRTALMSPPADPAQYPLVAPLKVNPPTSTGAIEFTFNRPDDGIAVKGTLSPSQNGKQQITLAPQKQGWSSATGTCQTG